MPRALIDTNLLVLLAAGMVHPNAIGEHRRLKQFSLRNFEVLKEICRGYPVQISVPNVLSEASNLIGSGDQVLAREAPAWLSRYISVLDEVYVPSSEVVKSPFYYGLGLTDAAIIIAARERSAAVLTSDHKLHGQLTAQGLEAINIFHFDTPTF